jgi:EAL domain-containing protein (putative c-di-GMP-specific phosphodiesterase class I)
MPFDMLKIDRSFVSDIGGAGEAESCAVASAVLGIAHSLGKEVCAEGVETEQQRAYLAERGCELVQGYLISRPLPTDEFERFVRNWHAAMSNLPGQPEDNVQTLAA